MLTGSQVGVAQDTQSNLANQLLTEAEKLRAAGTTASRREAIEKYNASLLLWQNLGDRAKEGLVRHSLCTTHNALGERQIALGYCEKAHALRRELGDQYGEAETLNLIGNLQLALHGPPAALDFFQRALVLRRAISDQRGVAVTLGNLARLYAQTGEVEKERDLLLEALPLAKALKKEEALEGSLLISLGNVHNRLDEVEAAFSYYQQALTLSQAIDNKRSQADALTSLGVLYIGIGSPQQALDMLTPALTLQRLIGNRAGEATTLINLAEVLGGSLGDASKALPLAEEALKLVRELQLAQPEIYALTILGTIYHRLGDNEKMLEYDQKALSLALGRKAYESFMLTRLTVDWLRLNNLPKAIEYGQRAVAFDRETGNRIELMYALHELCRAHHRNADYTSATAACRESLEITRQRGDREAEAKSLLELARIAAHQGDWLKARTLFEESLRLAETTADKLLNNEVRASFTDLNYSGYDDYIALLMKQHRKNTTAAFDKQALQVVERARARALLASLNEVSAGIRHGVDAALLEREQHLRKQLKIKALEQNRLSDANANQGRVSAVAREISELSVELAQVRGKIKLSSPRYAALTQPQPLATSQIKKEVIASDDTLLLEYALGEEQSFLWTISANSFNSYKLPKGEVIEKAAQRVYDLLTDRNKTLEYEGAEESLARHKKADADFQIAAAELSRMILAPVADELRAKRPKQLLIVADGKLQYVPFAALPVVGGRLTVTGKNSRASRPPATNYRPLISDYEIVNLPSASTLAVLRRELKDRQPAPKTLAIFADPVFDADDDRLSKDVRDRLAREQQTPMPEKAKPAEAAIADSDLTRAIRNVGLDGTRGGLSRLKHSRDEANAIVSLVPENERFSAMDFDANQDAALKPDLSQYRYVHFATHGFLDNQTPELSGLVLSQLDANGNKLDGYLRMVEIVNLNLPAEMVVLSACKTGIGKEVRGEGLMSLTRGFLYAGAKRVMVSLWNVDDKSTSVLMGEMYGHLLSTTPEQKLRPSAALRAAQLKMLRSKQWAAPYYWAAFVQLGEPR